MAESELPWDDTTDIFVTELDKKVEDSHGFKLRDLLLNPINYTSRADFADTFADIRKIVDDYFKGLHDTYADDEQKFNSDLEEVSNEYSKIDGLLSQKAAAASIPYIKPINVVRNTDNDENIVITKYEGSMDALFERLIRQSNYVADLSTQYKQYTIGSWLFSGSKQYLVSLRMPESIAFDLQDAESTIGALLDNINLLIPH
ncbi:MAG: hypothetical protein QW774_01970 [Candidatus Micrarchaeaceae archaeon]